MMLRVSRYVCFLMALCLLLSCDIFIQEEGIKSDRKSWEGLYGGATDIFANEEGELKLVEENVEVEISISFTDESNKISTFSFSTSSYYSSNLTDDPSTPNKLSKDSLILVDRDGKYQTDYLIEKKEQQLNGEARVFEQNSEGNYTQIELYEFAVSLVEN